MSPGGDGIKSLESTGEAVRSRLVSRPSDADADGRSSLISISASASAPELRDRKGIKELKSAEKLRSW